MINWRVAISHKKCTILVVFSFSRRVWLVWGKWKTTFSFVLQWRWVHLWIFNINYNIMCFYLFCVFFFLQNHEHLSNLQTIQTRCSHSEPPASDCWSRSCSSSPPSPLLPPRRPWSWRNLRSLNLMSSISLPRADLSIIQGQATEVPKRAVTEELTRESLLKEVQYRPHRPAPLLALMQTCPRPISNLFQVSTILRRWRHMEQTQTMNMN